ncbi:MAG: helix-hairpin-helix domain-containing protein, partial [Gimesia chilikensis]
MQNAEIARQFEELADLLEIQGANPFRLRAYRNAARTISGLPDSIQEIVHNDPKELQELPGIGKDLAEKIQTIVESSTLPQLEELKEQIPPDVVRMLDIPGIGPKKVAFLFSELNIHSLDDLKAAAENGVIAEQKGFGKKTEQIILEGLEQLNQIGDRVRLAEAKAQSDAIIADLGQLDSVQHISEAGSCRRRKETVGDLDILVTSSEPDEVMDALADHELVSKVLARGDTKQRVRLNSGLELDLRVVPEESYGAALLYFTG